MLNTPRSLTDILDDAAILSLEHQIHLSEVVGEHDWRVDLQNPVFEFTGERSLTCERFHLLGSAAPGPGSWMWAWANPSGFPAELTGFSARVRDLGHQYGIAELSDPEVPFDALPHASGEPVMAAAVLAEAAKVLTGSWTSYTGDAGGGTRVAFLIEHPAFLLPPPSPARTMRLLHQSLAELPLSDHRRALHGYAAMRGLDPVFDAEGRRLSFGARDFGVTVDFDDSHRVASINGTVPAGG
ncbi:MULTISPECIES: DUF6882 domain-containing protein [unclassified Nocardiopsis]|uniref:DUF6882 domain-containing protein n=1 Tax=unclassified Nocardiopsis TaxID=2649073 RepID=UPI000AC80BB3|nr:DUF6882 domain-containing protein [Nocardiopsis sp. TSRI0078]